VDSCVSRFNLGFELFWTNTTNMTVPARSIVEDVDVIRNIFLCKSATFVDVLLDTLLFQTSEEGFGDGVVPAVALAAHARFEMV
jgi:hypothetical protein